MNVGTFPHDNNIEIQLVDHHYSETFKARCESEVMFRKINTYLINHHIITNNVIDLGSWIGDNTIPWAMNMSQSIIYGIDPSIDNCNFIDEICKCNSIANVKTINKAISDQIETLTTNEDLYHCSFVFNTPGDNGIHKLESVTLDQLHDGGIITNIGYMHIDVEGMEYKVIQGASKIIQLYKPVIAFSQHIEKEDYNIVVSFLQRNGYVVFLINETLPGCWHDCRNFIAFPNHLYSETLRINIEHEFGPNILILMKHVSIAYVTGYIGQEHPTNLPDISTHVDSYFITNNRFVADEAESKYTKVIFLDNIENHETDPTEQYIVNSRDSKPLKVFPEKYLEKPYDFVVWYDNKFNVNVSDTMAFIHLWDYSKCIAMHLHPFNKTVVDEFNVAICFPRYKRQQNDYVRYIDDCKTKGLTEYYHKHSQTGFIIYNTHHQKTKEIQELWMSHINQCGIECQISFNMVRQMYESYIAEFPHDISR